MLTDFVPQHKWSTDSVFRLAHSPIVTVFRTNALNYGTTMLDVLPHATGNDPIKICYNAPHETTRPPFTPCGDDLRLDRNKCAPERM
jgi:hypothetical protein